MTGHLWCYGLASHYLLDTCWRAEVCSINQPFFADALLSAMPGFILPVQLEACMQCLVICFEFFTEKTTSLLLETYLPNTH
jgi:hypothetical protein